MGYGDGRVVEVDKNTELVRNSQSSLGQFGGKYIANTSATTPDTGKVFVAIQVVADAVVTLAGNITGITTVAFNEGAVIYGRYTSITLASGSVIAYQGV